MYVPALIGGLGPWELGIILVLVLILFGAGKLPQVFESFGIAVKKFRDAQKDGAIDVSPQDVDAEPPAERPAEIPEADEIPATEQAHEHVRNG